MQVVIPKLFTKERIKDDVGCPASWIEFIIEEYGLLPEAYANQTPVYGREAVAVIRYHLAKRKEREVVS